MATKAKSKKAETEVVEVASTSVKPVEEFTRFMPTGCVALDLELTNGKGLPVGGNILIFAPPATGKTTLIADVIRRILKNHENIGVPCRVVYLDTENSESLLRCIGKDPKDPSDLGLEKYLTKVEQISEEEYAEVEYKPHQLLYYHNVGTFKLAESIFTKYVKEDDKKENQDVKIIVIDSLTPMNSTTLAEAAVDKADFGSNAKERSRFYNKWLFLTRLKGITSIYTSQMRQKQNAGAYEDPLRAAVTKADEHNMDIIMKLTKSTDSKRVVLKKVKQKTIDGVVEKQTRYILKLSTNKTQGTKNRFWSAVDVECLVKPGAKTLNAFTVFNMLEGNGLYKRLNATTYTVSPEFASAFPDVDFGDITKGMPKKDLNIITSKNMSRFIEYLQRNDMYSITIGDVEELDDGLEC